MKRLIFILVLSLQVQAAERCAQYFEAIAELKVLSLQTKDLSTAFSKSLVEEPSEDAILKIAEAFHVSPDEIKADIAAAPVIEKIPKTKSILDPAKYIKQSQRELDFAYVSIQALYGGYLLAGSNKYKYHFISPTGEKEDVTINDNEKASNKFLKEQIVVYPKDYQLSLSGMEGVRKTTPSSKLVKIKNMHLKIDDKLLEAQNLVDHVKWAHGHDHIFALEFTGHQRVCLYEITKDDKLVPIKHKDLPHHYNDLIPSADHKKVLLIRYQENMVNIDLAVIWDVETGDLKKINLQEFRYLNAHFTSDNQVVFSNKNYFRLFELNGDSKEKHLINGAIIGSPVISPRGDHLVFTTHEESILFHFETKTQTHLPAHAYSEFTSFSPDEEKLYILPATGRMLEIWAPAPAQLKGPK